MWEVRDAISDPRTLANPLVTGELGLRFYLGVPLRTHDGHGLGTLCAIDREPRAASADDVATLTDLAGVVMDQLELRRAAMAAIDRHIEERERAEREAENLSVALATNRKIGVAIGIVMDRELCTRDEAFERLKVASQRAHRKLREIADEVIMTGALPELVRREECR